MNGENIISCQIFGILELLPAPYRPFNNFSIEHAAVELDLKTQQKPLNNRTMLCKKNICNTFVNTCMSWLAAGSSTHSKTPCLFIALIPVFCVVYAPPHFFSSDLA